MNQISTEDKNIRIIRGLIWLYFWLLIFEGALRKWVVPQLSNPLLIVRDPVVLAAYYFALRGHVFPKNGWVYAISAIGLLCFAQSFIPLWPYIPPARIALVSGYGFRASFLHLPFIFLIARVFRMQDVKRLGWWTLALLVPMTLLMVGQFQTGPESFLNRTAGGEGEMLTSALGKVRTAGTFSFVTGVVSFYALASGFLIWAALRRGVYRNWLVFAAGGALVIGIAISGSRSVVGACAVVAASLLVVLVLRPSAINRFGQTLVVVLILGLILTKTPIFREGLTVLGARFSEVAEVQEKSIGAGLIERFFGDFEEGLHFLSSAPFFGYGLGVGTNGGAKFLTGQSMFLLSEGEWSRIFLESGPILGLAFVLWRCGIVGYVGLLCVRAVKIGNVLPLLLFSSSCLPFLSGQFGQPTILGFAVLVLGLALAALQPAAESESDQPVIPELAPVRKIARRSAYADRLHGTPLPGEQSNGANHH